MTLKAGLLLPITLSVLFSGCMLGPDFHSPQAPITDKYTHQPLPAKTANLPGDNKAGKSQLFVYEKDIPGQWWQLYHSKELNLLIEKSLHNNARLAAAVATLKQARETLNGQIGNSFLPTLDANTSVARTRISGLGFGNEGPTNLFNIYNANATVSFPLDLFGANRRQVESSIAQMDYAEYQLDAAYLALTANIITTAVTISSLQDQLATTRALINESTQQLVIIKKQYQLGGASEQAVFSQETLVEQTKALLPPIEKSLAASQHALAVLVGELPSESNLPAISLASLTLPGKLPVSLPSELVKRRPDVRAAEALLHAASAQIGVATANLFPSITLTGTFGWTAPIPANLFQSNTKIWNTGAQLAQPIFHGGALFAARRAAIAAYEQAEAQYQQTVLQAFQNVADALRAVEIDARQYKAQAQAERSTYKTYLLTKKQYRLGGASLLQLLTAQQRYQQQRVLRIQAQAARYNDTAALFAALGGGWWHVDVECEVQQKVSAKA